MSGRAAAPAGSTAPAGQEQDLGTPITGTTNAGGGYTSNRQGEPIAVLIAGGVPSEFSAMDARTGKRLMTMPMPEVKAAWAYTTAPDRSVYIGTQSSAQVWRFDPDTLTLTQVVAEIPGQTVVWSAATQSDGQILFGTYPGGTVYRLNPVTKSLTDLGAPDPASAYIRSMSVARGRIYVGTGTHASIWTRPENGGGWQQIPLPSGYSDQQFVYDLTVVGNLLFVRFSPSATMIVYDLWTRKWVSTIPHAAGLAVSPAVISISNWRLHLIALIPQTNGPVLSYDLLTHKTSPSPLDMGNASARGWGLLRLGTKGFPGKSLVTMSARGTIFTFNPLTGKTNKVQGDATPAPYLIRSLATGPDGKVYSGGYQSPPGVGQTDPATGTSTLLPGPGQVEGFGSQGTDLLMGVYPGGRIYDYDTIKPWRFGTNPPAPLVLGNNQDRPVAITSAGSLTAIGSVPTYGHLGGALSLLDTATGTLSSYPNLVPDQTPISLAYRDGLLYIGTGIWGGLGVNPTTTEGHLAIFDVASHTLVYSGVPLPGEANISALTFDDRGNLWGMSANKLFEFDTASRTVVQTKQIFSVDDSAAYWTGRELFFDNGKLVGSDAGSLFEIDPVTLQVTTLATGVDELAIAGGDYYYAKDSSLNRWVPSASASPSPLPAVWCKSRSLSGSCDATSLVKARGPAPTPAHS